MLFIHVLETFTLRNRIRGLISTRKVQALPEWHLNVADKVFVYLKSICDGLVGVIEVDDGVATTVRDADLVLINIVPRGNLTAALVR